MSDFGFQGFNSGAGLLFDTSVMFSRPIGSFQIPLQVYNFQAPYSVSFGFDSTGGTPYTFITAIAGLSVPTSGTYAYSTPDININTGNSTITLSYSNLIASYPDDLATALYIGGLTVYWGIYYGPHDL